MCLACSQFDNEANNTKLPPPSFNNSGPIISSHRGHYLYPENTYEAIEAAIMAGFKMVEFDIQMTKDSVLVIHHDYTVDRCSNGTGVISKNTYEDLSRFDYGSWKGEEFSGIRLATLESVIQLAKWKNVLLEIDMTAHNSSSLVIDKAYEMVERYNMVDKVLFIVIASNAKRVSTISKNKANVSVLVPVEPERDKKYALQELFSIVSNEHYSYCCIKKDLITHEIFNLCKEKGARVEVWGIKTENELDEYIEEMRCDNIMVEDFIPQLFNRNTN